MGKASSSKKVARAAGIGGGRTNRGKAPVLWYSTLVVILLAGVGLTTFSRDQRLEELGSPTSKEAPRANADHWHVALGVRVCDKWLDPIQDQADPKGVHSHGDGIIHIHPFVASAAGRRSTFARYAEAVKGELAVSKFSWPEGASKKKVEHETGDKCGEQEGEVKTFYNGEPHDGDPGAIRFTDRGKLVLAFVAKGTTYEQIGDPPSAPGLDNLSDVDPADQQQSQSGAAAPDAAAHDEGDSHAPGAHDEAPADPTVSTTPADGATATTVAPAPTTPPSSEAPPSSSAPPAGG